MTTSLLDRGRGTKFFLQIIRQNYRAIFFDKKTNMNKQQSQHNCFFHFTRIQTYSHCTIQCKKKQTNKQTWQSYIFFHFRNYFTLQTLQKSPKTIKQTSVQAKANIANEVKLMQVLKGLMRQGAGGSVREGGSPCLLHLRSCGTRSLNSLTALN